MSRGGLAEEPSWCTAQSLRSQSPGIRGDFSCLLLASFRSLRFPGGSRSPAGAGTCPARPRGQRSRPSMPAAQRPPPGSFSMARGHPGPAPRASRGNLAAGARSSPPNPAPCHRPRADGNETPPLPARHMPFHKGSEPAGATRCLPRCRSLPARFQPSLHPGPGRGWMAGAPGEPEPPNSLGTPGRVLVTQPRPPRGCSTCTLHPKFIGRG